MGRATEMWTFFGSLLGIIAFGQTIINTLLPVEVQMMFGRVVSIIVDWCSNYSLIDIPEFDGVTNNELYGAIKLHLSCTDPLKARRLNMCRTSNSSSFTCSPANNETISDDFSGSLVYWQHNVIRRENQRYTWRMSDEARNFILKVHKKDKERVLLPYLENIMEHAREIRRLNRDRLLYTNSKGASWEGRSQPWESVSFKHPSTFETLALDPVRKKQIMEDLQAFIHGEEFYRKTGRAWKRGYLLYGPPGTGKSSMIAAMANYLGYDIYDLELTEVQNNADLRKLLIRTTNKSIIVIEDIDCSLNLTNRSAKKPPQEVVDLDPFGMPSGNEQSTTMTLSGLLNFTDGLWSCCGSERIFVFTTNYIDRLDPALLRSGRMDMHIHMSYCTFPAFKILVYNYLGIDDHPLFPEIEQMIDSAEMTPADVSEVLIKHRESADLAMSEFVKEMKAAKNKPQPSLPEKHNHDTEEEKHAVEKEKADEPGKSVVTCETCLRIMKVIHGAEEKKSDKDKSEPQTNAEKDETKTKDETETLT